MVGVSRGWQGGGRSWQGLAGKEERCKDIGSAGEVDKKSKRKERGRR